MQESKIIIEVITNAKDLDFDINWWEIYRENFPVNQRDSTELIFDSVQNKNAFAFRAKVESITVGIALAFIDENPAVIFLDYLAVHQEFRGKKIGAKIFQFVEEFCSEILKSKFIEPIGLFWEVEKLDKESKQKIEFFKKMGGGILPINYYQPLIVQGEEPESMYLMCKLYKNRSLSKDDIYQILHSIYFDGYSIDNEVSKNTLEKSFIKLIDGLYNVDSDI